ncbi:MAG TPA: beta-ketoacyl-[acyl-carrier-protein] synthase family protein [Kofleriaceae bacterium]
MAAILGYGAVSSVGYGAQRIWSAMAEGWDGIEPVRRFDVSTLGTRLGALVPDRNAPEHGGARLCIELAVAAGREALQRAQLDTPANRIGLVLGTSLGEPGVLVHELTAAIADALGIAGPRLTISTACASSTNAIGMALDWLAQGAADVVVAGGADVLTPLVYAGFAALGVLSTEKCAPFAEPPGTTLGEGAGFVVLGRDRPNAPAIVGYGISTDAYHDTGPDPTGAGMARSMRGALLHAGVAATQIDYVNAHGTGTRANDPAEWRAIQAVLGDRAHGVPVSSSKSFLGHAQGAAGVLELIATLIAMEQGALPPTQRASVRRSNTPPDVVAAATARPGNCDVALKHSAGFGGANASLVIARSGASPAVTRRPVWLASAASATAESSLPPSIDPRGLDPSTRNLTAAVAAALDNAGLRMRGDARDRTGMIVGLVACDRESDVALHAIVGRDGLRALSANLFARQTLNAAPGTCARLLGVRGMHSVISAGSASPLAAAVYAAELLASRRDADAIVAASVDDARGAAAVVLASSPTDIRVASWRIAGVGSEPIDHADMVVDDLQQAVELIRGERACRVVVRQSAAGCADFAMILVGGRHES